MNAEINENIEATEVVDQLVWSADREAWQAAYDETHTLFVDNDEFAEAVRDRARYLAAQRYPDMNDADVRQFLASASPESDAILDQAHEENLDAYLWAECVSLDDQQELIWIEESEALKVRESDES